MLGIVEMRIPCMVQVLAVVVCHVVILGFRLRYHRVDVFVLDVVGDVRRVVRMLLVSSLSLLLEYVLACVVF